ncbi:MAG: VOC family protein [Legionellales bacterium]|nr:VOC family protein [Legionellales bacterium]
MNKKNTHPLIQPYLFFNGCCEEALEFYKTVLNAEIEMLMRFNESPEPIPTDELPTGFNNKIMHASFKVGDATVMASDGYQEGSNFAGFSLALTFATVQEVQRVFHLLADGGEVQMPLAETFWSALYGSVTDRFGINWMVMVEAKDLS